MNPVNTSQGNFSGARKYIRHPAEIPIEYELTDFEIGCEPLANISIGGLAFSCDHPVPENASIIIRIPLVAPELKMHGRVVWCREIHDHFDVGVQFTDSQTEFRIRMVEQICHIEQYKRMVAQKEGRELTGEEAALEWIEKFADHFPHSN